MENGTVVLELRSILVEHRVQGQAIFAAARTLVIGKILHDTSKVPCNIMVVSCKSPHSDSGSSGNGWYL